MTTPEVNPNKPKKVIEIINEKVTEIITKVKEKFKKQDHKEKSEKYGKNKPANEQDTDAQKKQKRDGQKQLLNELNVVIQTESLTMVQDVKAIAQQLSQEITQAQHTQGEKAFADALDSGAAQLTNDTALPFARFVLQAQQDGLFELNSSEKLKKVIAVINESFVHETDARGKDLKPAIAVLEKLMNAYPSKPDAATVHEYTQLINDLKGRGAEGVDAAKQRIDEALAKKQEQDEVPGEVYKRVEKKLRDIGMRPGDISRMRNTGMFDDGRTLQIIEDDSFSIPDKRRYLEMMLRTNVTESVSTENLVESYKKLESAIAGSSLDDTQKRKALYDLLEVDLDHQIEVLQEIRSKDRSAKPDEILEAWANHFIAGAEADGKRIDVEDYKGYDQILNEHAALPDEIKTIAQEYKKNYVEFFKKRLSRLTRFNPQMGDSDDPYTNTFMRAEPLDLSVPFGGIDSSGFVALAFIDNSSNLDIKDIYVRSKVRSMMRKHFEEHGSHEFDDYLKNPELPVSIEEFSENVVGDLKAPYILQAKSAIKKTGARQQELEYVLQKINTHIANSAFSSSDFRFLGGFDETSKQFQRISVLSRTQIEHMSQPALFGSAFVETSETGNARAHQNLQKFMEGFSEGARHIQSVAEMSKRFKEGFISGDINAIKQVGTAFTNEMFDTLSSEGPIIAAAAKAYVDSFKRSILLMGGQQRPSRSAVSMESGESPQEAEMKRVLRAAFPNKSGDELEVYMAIGQMYAVAQGDLIHVLARAAPPMDIKGDPIKFYNEMQPKLNAIEERMQGRSKGEIFEEKSKVLFDYASEQNPEIATVTYDAFMRVMLMSVNPIYYKILWANMAQEHKLQDIFFGGAYALGTDDYDRNPVMRTLFGSKDRISSGWDILKYAPDAKRAIFTGLSNDLLEQRIKGEVPMSARMVGLAGYSGIAERGSWRWDIEQLDSFVSDFLNERRRIPREGGGEIVRPDRYTQLSEAEITELIGRSIYLGPSAAMNLVKALFSEDKDTAETKWTPEKKAAKGRMRHLVKQEEGQLKKYLSYVDKLVYEYFPSAFTMHGDINQWIHVKDKRFDQLWEERLMGRVGAGEFSALIPSGRSETNFGITQLGTQGFTQLREASVTAKQLMGVLFETEAGLETLLTQIRNATSEKMWHQGPPVNMRETLALLNNEALIACITEDPQRGMSLGSIKAFLDSLQNISPSKRKAYETILPAAVKYIRDMKRQRMFSGTGTEVFKTIMGELYQAYYGKKPETHTLASSTTNRGLLQGVTYHNLGASKEGDRRKRVDTFTFLRGLESKKYIYNVFHSELENFGKYTNVQHTGDGNSGKSLVSRKFADVATFMDGQGKLMSAFEIIPQGMRALGRKDYSAAEDAYLKAVLDASKVFESYNDENKRHEIATQFIIEWIMVARNQRHWGVDLSFLSKVFGPIGAGKINASFADLVSETGRFNKSEMNLDYGGVENFIAKAQKMGLLPMNIEGKTVAPMQYTDIPLGIGGVFKKADEYVQRHEEKLRSAPPPAEMAIINREITQLTAKKRSATSETEKQAIQLEIDGLTQRKQQMRDLSPEQKFSFRERVAYRLFKPLAAVAGESFLHNFNYKKTYAWNAKRISFMSGKSWGKDRLQWVVIGFMIAAAVAALALTQGLKELDVKA